MRREDSPRLMTPGTEAMIRLCEDAGEADRLCREVRVLTGGSGPLLDTCNQGRAPKQLQNLHSANHRGTDTHTLTSLGLWLSRSVWLGSKWTGLTTRRPPLSPAPPLAEHTSNRCPAAPPAPFSGRRQAFALKVLTGSERLQSR
ncbi:unnamed protein product [Menidia menidia]|uniref:(Atlantic silverside) hypothetical protein n=1 Tax=Menidia menidia TaxID=238744 RepID=A0A8S4B2Q7_9TELE|nr:unnamed protein product [Menidia menidia]